MLLSKTINLWGLHGVTKVERSYQWFDTVPLITATSFYFGSRFIAYVLCHAKTFHFV